MDLSLEWQPEIAKAFSAADGMRYVAKIKKKGVGTLCMVEYWAHNSCATNALCNFHYGFDTYFPEVVEFLKTQPQLVNLGGMSWKACIFTLLPAHKTGENIRKLTQVIAEFPNYAHETTTLQLRLLDLTKV